MTQATMAQTQKWVTTAVCVEAVAVALFVAVFLMAELALNEGRPSNVNDSCVAMFSGSLAIFFILAGLTSVVGGLAGKHLAVRRAASKRNDGPLIGPKGLKAGGQAAANDHVDTLYRIRDKAQSALSAPVSDEVGDVLREIWFAVEIDLENIERRTEH